MAVNGSITIENSTGKKLLTESVAWLDDDAKRSGLRKNDTFAPDQSRVVTMSTESVILMPKGIGVQFELVEYAQKTVNIVVRLEIPAVGAHSLDTMSSKGLKSTYSNIKENDYKAVIELDSSS